jgi:cysteine-rich repeat protein
MSRRNRHFSFSYLCIFCSVVALVVAGMSLSNPSNAYAGGFCGDGELNSGEECDDGNTANGDGCSADCTVEAPDCGDGELDPGEECDDGNNADGDGCSADCEVEPFCGDGNLDPGEECDDGNNVDGDGCEADCTLPGDIGCVGSPGFWKNHPDAWPVDEITIGGVTYTKEEAIEIMFMGPKGDKTLTMFDALVAAKLNVLAGSDDACIENIIADADFWMYTYGPVGSGVHAGGKFSPWRLGEPLYEMLDQYNNGNLCVPKCH